MKSFFLAVAFLSLVILPTASWAQRVSQSPMASMSPLAEERIAAVVNESVISTTDVRERLLLGMLSSGLPDTPEVRQHLLPQVLHGLIDEQLQLQEAKRVDITISDEEVNQAMEHVAHENNIPGDMRTYVESHGVSPNTLVNQIRAALAWNKVIQRELRPRVEIGDDEVDAVIERIRANAGKEEYLVSEIVLLVDSPKDEDEVKQLADNLVEQLRNGANFAAVARQFSQGTGAASGGDIGWIQEGVLAPELNQALIGMDSGKVVGPIRSASGYHILGVREKRTISLGDPKNITLNLQQVFHPFSSDMGQDVLVEEADRVRSTIKGCSNLQNNLAAKFPDWHWQNLGDVPLGKMPPDIIEKIRDVPVGAASQTLATDRGALILFVCDRHFPENAGDREAILSTIGTERLELQARRLLRDLRRAAYLDIRLGSSPS